MRAIVTLSIVEGQYYKVKYSTVLYSPPFKGWAIKEEPKTNNQQQLIF
jgi:hypothetical protein